MVATLAALTSAAAQTPADVALFVSTTTTPSSVRLAWSDGDPTFVIFRAADPDNVLAPANEIGATVARTWIDTPPPGDVFYYRLGERSPTHAETVGIELLRPNDDPIGRPLPIAAHWNTGHQTSVTGWTPDYMIDLLEAGEFVLPAFRIEMPLAGQQPWSHYESGLQRARALGLPFSIRFTQWDRLFSDDPKYHDLPPGENPNVVDAADGTTILPMTDPEGPVEHWEEVGAEWGDLQVVNQMQAEYPNPPLVIWLNNFEHPRLQPADVEQSWRFVQNHGLGTTDEQRRRILGDGWIERDGALYSSLSDRLSPAWQGASIPVCYSAFGRRHYGSWSGWDRKSLHVPGRFAPWPSAVNGSPSYYVFGNATAHGETDFEADGPQALGMNWIFMLEEAYRDAPDYFWEVSIYDGGVERHEWYRNTKLQTYDEARYKGYVRYALWLSRPRIAREFRLNNEDRSLYETYWETFLQGVREVHTDADLTRFWRRGTLLANTTHPHQHQANLVPGYTDDDVDRNYLPEVSVNPPRPWNNATEIPVWALAYVLGEAPDREWLLFAYAPLADHDDVTIGIPGYQDVVVDVPRGGGAFWLFVE
ncbi:MAG: hypothetical protein GY716_19175 [bacterium]|nr:hypothetical protein [bacterium]